jgi:hypothetical protein
MLLGNHRFATCSRCFVMPEYATVEEAITPMQSGVQPLLIAIDGLPCSGKSTMVDRLKDCFEFDCMEALVTRMTKRVSGHGDGQQCRRFADAGPTR